MKVLALVIVAVASVSAKGSGPYLPSGWKPEGPAFYLPSEILKPSEAPVVDLSLQGSEASGSDFLREYGPPKVQEVSQNLINQGLPDVTIEQDFGFVAQNAVASEFAPEKLVVVTEVKPEVVSTEESATEARLIIDSPISAELPILDFVVQETTVAGLETATELASQPQSNQQSNEDSSTYQQETSTVLGELEKVTSAVAVDQTESSSEIASVPVSVQQLQENLPVLQNIPEIIASFDKEILNQQAEVNQAVSEITTVQGVSGSSEQLPEGFLEYGPPGFAEYGPPKTSQDKSENIQTLESNETRRRRFSPRLRLVKKH